MQVVIRSKPGSLRTPMSFVVSATIHGSILAWLALSPQRGPAPRRLSIYEQEIQPNEKRIVWYHLSDRLPDVRPAETRKDQQQPRALRPFDQSIVAGNKDKPGSDQMIFMPAPEIRDPKPLPLPNVLAVSRPARSVRPFTPPPETQKRDADPALPDAPEVAPTIDRRSLPFSAPPARPLKTFTPPPEIQSRTPKLTLPDAPQVAAISRDSALPADLARSRVQPRGFTPPLAPVMRAVPVAIPEAPGVASPNQTRNLPAGVADPRAPRKRFDPPPAPPVRTVPVLMPEAPGVAGSTQARTLPAAVPDPRAPLRRFNPPPTAGPGRNSVASAELPAAPEVAASHQAGSLPTGVPDPRAPLRRFNPPPAAGPARAGVVSAELPAAPEVAVSHQAGSLPAGVPDPRAPLRRFNPPPSAGPAKTGVASAELPAAPEVAATHQARSLPAGVPDPRAPLKRFNPPPAGKQGQPAASAADLPSAPSVAGASGTAEATLAVVGLHPTKAPDFPTPPGSVQGGFSGGPKPNPQGSEGAAKDAAIVVPSLTARGGAKDTQPTLAAVDPNPMSKENLLAAARVALSGPPPDSAMPNATRVTNAPEERLAGRAVYSIAIQMPNVTSYSGSWIVWFSERQPIPGAPPPEVRAPVPLRKVDPKYIPEAAQDRVEGTVRLFAVIRRDGHVESVSLLRHLDDRLDQSAQEALAKWIFEPALRNGTPMDVEAVFEIPFRLAPRSVR